jgi:hypothetical protein
MTGTAWEQLAIQVPVVVVFTGALFFIMREMFRAIQTLTDKYMQYIDNRDKAIAETLNRISSCLTDHDRISSAHDQFVRDKIQELLQK